MRLDDVQMADQLSALALGQSTPNLAARCRDNPTSALTIALLYQIILGRAPDGAGLLGYLDAHLAGRPVKQIAKDLLASAEYACTSSDLPWWHRAARNVGQADRRRVLFQSRAAFCARLASSEPVRECARLSLARNAWRFEPNADEEPATRPTSTVILDKPYYLNRSTAGDHRPRILVLPAIFAVGGAERNIIALMLQLAPEYRFIVVTNMRHSAAGGCLLDAVRDCSEAIFDLAATLPEPLHLNALTEICRVYPPDLVWVGNGSHWFHANLNGILRLFADVPIVDQQVYDHQSGWISQIGQNYVDSVARMIAINSKIEQKFGERFNARAKTELIYHALDLARLHPPRHLEPPSKRRRYVLLGRLAEQKRPLDLIHVAALLSASHPDLEFEIVGDGPLRATCANEIASLGLVNVHMMPFTDAVSDIYSRADAMLLVSAYEGLPIVMLEALASGVPVLATDVGDIRKVADMLGGGCVVVSDAIGRPDRFAAALAEFDANLAGHQAAAHSVARLVTETFGAPVIARQYGDCFRRTLRQPADSSRRASP